MGNCNSLTSSDCHGLSTDHSSRRQVLYYVSDVIWREPLGVKFAVSEVSQLSGHEYSQSTQDLTVYLGLTKKPTNNQFTLLTWIRFQKKNLQKPKRKQKKQTNQTKTNKAKISSSSWIPSFCQGTPALHWKPSEQSSQSWFKAPVFTCQLSLESKRVPK